MIVSYENIEKAAEKVNDLLEHDPTFLMDSMSAEQPYVFGYVMAMGEEISDEEALNDLIFLTVIIWYSYAQQHTTVPMVSAEVIEHVEEKNIQMLDDMQASSDEEASEMMIADSVEKGFRQKELFGFLASELLENEEKVTNEEIIGLMFTILKVVIESFDNATRHKI